MSEIKLTPYQATVFRDVEHLLKTTGNPSGIAVNPKAYWLSKKMAVYIMHNIAKNQSTAGGGNILDVENVYQWLFGVLPTVPNTPVSNTGNPNPPTTFSQIEYHGPFLLQGEAWHYPLPMPMYIPSTFPTFVFPPPPDSTPRVSDPQLGTRMAAWLGRFQDLIPTTPTTVGVSEGTFNVDGLAGAPPQGFYKIISKQGPKFDNPVNFDLEYPGVEVFESRLLPSGQNGIVVYSNPVPLP